MNAAADDVQVLQHPQLAPWWRAVRTRYTNVLHAEQNNANPDVRAQCHRELAQTLAEVEHRGLPAWLTELFTDAMAYQSRMALDAQQSIAGLGRR